MIITVVGVIEITTIDYSYIMVFINQHWGSLTTLCWNGLVPYEQYHCWM